MTHSTYPPLSDNQIQRRAEAVAFSRGSVRLEGFVPSPECEALLLQGVNGEITSEQSIEALNKLYKTPHD